MRRIGSDHIGYTQLATHIMQYAQCDSIAEASAILDEAYSGNPAAQYITAMALVSVDESSSNKWMNESAARGFKPAQVKIRRASSKGSPLGSRPAFPCPFALC